MGIFVYKNGKTGFRVIEAGWDDGKTTKKTVPKTSYHALGFRDDMTLNEARLRAKQLRLQSSLEHKKQIQTAKRVEHDSKIKSAYLPSEMVSKFEEYLGEITFGKDDRIDTVLKNWNTVQRIISELELDPKDFYDARYKFYKAFINKKYSPDYVARLVRILNLWGVFVSKQHNSFFQPIPPLKNIERQKLVEARENKKGVRREADPLTQQLLFKFKETFQNAKLGNQWNWLFIACWFGLRPSEVDGLHKLQYKLQTDARTGLQVLMVYQTKLSSLPKDKRWKPIPIFFEEQKEALKLIESGEFKRPLAKTLKRYIGDSIDNYSPRKAFTDLMLNKGIDLEDVAVFLGHSSIETTWKHYKDKFTFKMPKTS